MRHAEDSFLVTTAALSPRDELRQRTRRYLVTMAARVVCIILAIVLYQLKLHWEAAFAIAGSLVLPWIAVVAANAGPARDEPGNPSLYAPPQRRGINAGDEESQDR